MTTRVQSNGRHGVFCVSLWAAIAMLGSIGSGGGAIAQDQLPPPPDELSGPVEALQALQLDVDQLLKQGVLREDAHRKLTRSLERSTLYLYQANPEGALGQMDHFAERVRNLSQRGILDEKQLLGLLSQSTSIGDGISLLASPTPPQLDCAGVLPVYHVDAAAEEGGDGSAGHPFRTLAEAFEGAALAGLYGIEIRLALGHYEEDIEITRHTRIIGEFLIFLTPVLAGSIRSVGPFCLEIDGLTITDGVGASSGAIHVSHPSARTSLSRVLIRDAGDFGLIHHGGTLTVGSLVVDGTRPLDEKAGVAVYLSGGVEAHLQHTWLTRNYGSGLIVRDAGTNVLAERLRIERTVFRPLRASRRGGFVPGDGGPPTPDFSPTPGLAALDIRNDARFEGWVVAVSENEYAGIYVESRAEAEMQYVYASRTREAVLLAPEAAGINVWCRDHGRLRLTNFTISRADLCGVTVGEDGNVDLSHGVVSRNPVAVCIWDHGYDTSRLSDHVLFLDNGSTFESISIGIPPPQDPRGL